MLLPKFVPPAEVGSFARIFEDTTVALPVVGGAILERLGKFQHKTGEPSRHKKH